jgi:hypothetical protein
MLETAFSQKYRNSEFIKYMDNVTQLINRRNATGLPIKPQTEALQSLTTEMGTLFKQEQGTLITKEIEALDKRRDDAFTGLRSTINGYRYHFIPQQAKAAAVLYKSIDKLGKNIARLNYQAETATLEKLVHDWETDTELVAAIAELGLEDWMRELKTANDEFNQRYLDRTSEYASLNKQQRLPELRARILEAYRTLIDHITAHATLTPSEVYSEIIGDLNALTQQYNELVTERISAKNQDTDLEALPQDEPDETD